MTAISAEPVSTGANSPSCCAPARSWPTAIGSSASSWTRAPTPAGAPGAQARAILGAMAASAAVHGEGRVTDADSASLAAAYHFLLRQSEQLDFGDPAAFRRPTPTELARALPERRLATEAAHMLTIMAFVDGSLDAAKIRTVLDYAAALGIDEPYIQEITEAAQGHVA